MPPLDEPELGRLPPPATASELEGIAVAGLDGVSRHLSGGLMGPGQNAPVGIPPRNKARLTWPTVPMRDLRREPWVFFRPSRNEPVSMPLGKLASHHIRGAYPAREPANYKEKTPTSGAFWSSTENDLVLYESLLERQTIMLADFDTNIVGIISQPFRIVALVAGRRRFHTPDYALVHMDGEMEIVNCKPHDHVKKPAVVELHTWVEAVLGQAGLRHRVVSELPSQRATNLAFIAHMRNPRWLMSLPIDVVAAECVEAITLGALVDALAPALDAPTVIACVRALLWIQVLFVDLDAPITLNSLLLVSDA